MRTEQIQAVLQDIQNRIPSALKRNVFIEKPKTPTMAFVVDKILEEKAGSDEDRARLQVLKDAGEFDKKMVVENTKIVKLIDQFVTREIKKAVKEGRLPKDGTAFLPKLKELYESIHKTTDTK